MSGTYHSAGGRSYKGAGDKGLGRAVRYPDEHRGYLGRGHRNRRYCAPGALHTSEAAPVQVSVVGKGSSARADAKRL